jgi:lipopolysaccharide/colanic/teichoic acid biosynthesis glycosyltransferase
VTQHSNPPRLGRRLAEIAVAGAGLLLLSPFLAVIALLVLAADGPPVLFRQERIGRLGRPFQILKFRTMRASARGPRITAAGDRRITAVGVWLRRLKLDELPQLLNVLRGDMSLIGPRPEVPEYVDLKDDLWRRVLQFRPGITDAATLAFRNEEEVLAGAADWNSFYRGVILPRKLALNLRYQENRSTWSDLRLLWLTVRYSFLPRGFDPARIQREFGL